MANNGRCSSVNLSEFLANLNAIPSAQELQDAENFTLEDDTAMFTTQFFDFDLGQDVDLHPSGFDESAGATTMALDDIDLTLMDFNVHEDFNILDFLDFSTFTQAAPTFHHDELLLPQLPSIQTKQPHTAPTSSSSASSSASPSARTFSTSTDRTTPAAAVDDFEEASRLAAEDDKRRRNTVASARFRVKKKQRDEALERSAKEMSDKVSTLGRRINLLEAENKWLKGLITENIETKADVAELWEKYSREAAGRIAAERKDGVGTKGAKATTRA